MNRVVHFEIHADDMERAKKFYSEVFGWKFEDYTEYVGSPYFGVITGEGEPGINGGMVPRKGARAAGGPTVSAYVATIGVANYDETEAKILSHGGKVSQAKYALPAMAWQGYYLDTEGNIFGIHEADENAK